jgi:hypothetical protein
LTGEGEPVGNNKDPNVKRPGEKEEGTFHYNPGNMSGKTGEDAKKKPGERLDPDRRKNEQKNLPKQS